MTINSYYNVSGTPTTGASGSSAAIRAEYALIAAGFALLPTLSGNGSKAVVVNSGGSALTVTTGTLALAGNFATTGAFNTTLAQTASVTLTLPAVSGTLATLAGTETLSNKTFVTPALGTPASGILTNCTGTAAGLTAGTVTTNANLTGPITSVGNATSIAAKTGTGTTFVVDTSPTLVTPALGVATATSLAIGGATIGTNGLAVTGHVLLEGVTSTGATGTGNLAFSASPTFTGTLTAATSSFSGHMTVEGVTSTGATGTGAFVFASSPSLTTPALGVATGTSLALGGATLAGNALAVTGTGFISSSFNVGTASTNSLQFAGSGTNPTIGTSGGAISHTAQVLTLASATGTAGLNIPHGTAPSSPVNGDIWTTTAGIYVRINGATVGPLGVAPTLGLTDGGLQTSNFNVVVGTKYTAEGSGITATGPASAATNDVISIAVGSTSILFSPNGLKVNGSTATISLPPNNTYVMTYNSTQGWV